MLGVAMARSADGQRWPGLGETVSLIAGTICTRIGIIPAGIRNEAWQRASAVVTIIGAILLASSGARALFLFAYDSNDSFGDLSRGPLAECAGWALVAIAAVPALAVERTRAGHVCRALDGLDVPQNGMTGCRCGWSRLVRPAGRASAGGALTARRLRRPVGGPSKLRPAGHMPAHRPVTR
jgi:hypothetical protein